MELARNAMRSNIQDMSNQEYEEFIEKMLKEADSDAEAGEIKSMYDKIRGAKAKGGKVRGYRYGTPKGGVKKMKSCRGRKAQGNKE